MNVKLKEAIEALESAMDEMSWFVLRKKNLNEKVGTYCIKTWADVLDEDLGNVRKALAALRSIKPATEQEVLAAFTEIYHDMLSLTPYKRGYRDCERRYGIEEQK